MKLKTRIQQHEQRASLCKMHKKPDLFDRGWRDLPYGKERRQKIFNYIWLNPEGIPVNNKYQIQTKWDKDLKKLLKSGMMEMVKLGTLGKRQTWVRLV